MSPSCSQLVTGDLGPACCNYYKEQSCGIDAAFLQNLGWLKIRLFCSQDGKKKKKKKVPWAVNTTQCISFLLYETTVFFSFFHPSLLPVQFNYGLISLSEQPWRTDCSTTALSRLKLQTYGRRQRLPLGSPSPPLPNK